MGFFAPHTLGQPGGFDLQRAEETNRALRGIFGEQQYEIEHKRPGMLALIRCAIVEVPRVNDEFVLIERVLRTGIVRRNTSNSFEIVADTPSAESPTTFLQTDFRYLPYRDGLGVHRSLHDLEQEVNKDDLERDNRQRIAELLGGLGAATAEDWQEFKDVIGLMQEGIVNPVVASSLYIQ